MLGACSAFLASQLPLCGALRHRTPFERDGYSLERDTKVSLETDSISCQPSMVFPLGVRSSMGIGRQRAASLGDMRARVGVTLAEWSDVPSMDCWASISLSQSTRLASPIPTGWESGVFVFLI